ncbi:sugar phosphate isomerase/epimerase and 4-hydroxyphenylpyruvate domain-containing protein [Novosphingobium sp.]|uniref:bifunctional sugar phosphate isomerase/epimerase/4-hydroxyphenylpyruvate dioxygenase family protein n=1 Tax=Novosphingobium sp. TaxID=1874826 RepID=UPI0026198C42|nr:sugar phosphate isomerase/epimerase and 4-hydroxyphenylpyruvate domain-containing protein [Novosphingobium sp.]
MTNAIASVSLSGTLEDKIRAAAAAGFDEIEIFDVDFLASPLSARETRTLIGDLGLSCSLYQPFRDLEGMPDPLRARAFDRLRQKFDVMAELGCDRLLLCSNCSPLASDDRPRIVADLREVGEIAAERDLLVGYEALAWATHVWDHRVAWDIVRAVDHPHFGLLLDSFHSLARAVPNESIREIDPAKIVYVQLADAPVLDMNRLYWSRHFRNLPGQGGLDVEGYVTELTRIGYTGPLSLEIFNDRFRSTSAALVARDGVRSLNALRDAAARNLGQPTRMPGKAEILGVEFVEFAVAPEDRSALEQTIAAMGFVCAGRHRSKPVTLWRCGATNLVLNFADDGFARAYRLTHGTAICAIGLVVDNSAAAIRRAEALGGKTEGTDIPSMPAIRGVGGSLVYVLDQGSAETIWASEFDLVPVEPAGEGAIEGFDHLAVAVHNDEFLSWQLYWRALFDVQVQEAQDVIDPNGLVVSQAIQNASGTFRLTMNATDARDALSSRFLSQTFGAGFQHLAFHTGDLPALARAVRAGGLGCLPIPANYQDDALARFGLSAEESAVLRELDILVDEDARGNRYRQFYSRAFNKSFFFEFVERSGYEGYGAPNAPIRLAAQSRYRVEPLP